MQKMNRTGLITDFDYVKTVCKIGQDHACCRYLLVGGQGFECAKLQSGSVRSLAGDRASSAKELLDQRVIDQTINARGDNCEGR